MKQVTILGATGSIGVKTVDVVLRHPDAYQVYALTTFRRLESLMSLALRCRPKFLVVADGTLYTEAKRQANALGIASEILVGEDGLKAVASAPEVDSVMAAIVGAAGLLPTMAAVRAGKRVLLANKEALVMSGGFFIDAARLASAEILPIDSEHNAIFQCLPRDFGYGDLASSGIHKLLLTGSGGPFRERDITSFGSISVDEACRHPNWSMGRKITVDSATMMNKGLEFIEAHWLFGVPPKDIEVVIHPQSIIHSMVQYVDGSVLAQLGNPDMRTPIAYGLAYPERINAGVEPLNFSQLRDLTFCSPCEKRYPNLSLAVKACEQGQSSTTVLNAANEVAVDAFLAERISFTAIAAINEEVLTRMEPIEVSSLQQILEIDVEARQLARQLIGRFAGG